MGRLLKIIDFVSQCYSNDDGETIQKLLLRHFRSGEKVIVSFKGIDSASSSFINSAFIDLLETYDFDFIKEHLGFSDANRTINETIKRRFAFEVNNRKRLLEV
ncbi:hypothetical protein BSK59_08680 [Paenibacillus odorifer]|uniref:STAS-like domain-containing protein n=1 Tax=Paenibacillus TaxID=44249 RepID=UPI00096EBF58|nr:STAS-like domain-containing protein [Paenibacillus odorifer]OME58247.1 hypothetical protein BSK59_08680 [Paenibacillus odorifer]